MDVLETSKRLMFTAIVVSLSLSLSLPLVDIFVQIQTTH